MALNGGKDEGEMVRAILSRIMNNDIMTVFNVHEMGQLGKKPIKDTEIMKCIICKLLFVFIINFYMTLRGHRFWSALWGGASVLSGAVFSRHW